MNVTSGIFSSKTLVSIGRERERGREGEGGREGEREG